MRKFIVILLVGTCFAQTNLARMLSGINYQTGTSYTFVSADSARVTSFNNTNPVAVTLPTGLTAGFWAGTVFSASNSGLGTVTITCVNCTINGGTTLTLSTSQSSDIYSDGHNYIASRNAGAANVSAGASGQFAVYTTGPSIGADINLDDSVSALGVISSKIPLAASQLTASGLSVGSAGNSPTFPAILMENDPICGYSVVNGSDGICFWAGPLGNRLLYSDPTHSSEVVFTSPQVVAPVAGSVITADGSGNYNPIPVLSNISSPYINATTSFSTISLAPSINIAASAILHIACSGVWQNTTGASTSGPKFQWLGPGSPTAVSANAQVFNTVSTVNGASVVAFSSSMADAGAITAQTNFPFSLTLDVINGVTAGQVQLQSALNSASGSLTIQPGFTCRTN